MARDITAGMLTEITATTLSPVWLVKVEFDSGTVRLWTGNGDITYDSEIYQGAGNLLGIEEIEENTGLVAASTVITFAGLDATLIALALTEDYQERPVTVYFGALDTSRALITSPYLQLRGRMDVMSLSNSGDVGICTATVENILTDLERPKVGRYTDEDQKARYAGDKFFEFVESLQDKEVALT